MGSIEMLVQIEQYRDMLQDILVSAKEVSNGKDEDFVIDLIGQLEDHFKKEEDYKKQLENEKDN